MIGGVILWAVANISVHNGESLDSRVWIRTLLKCARPFFDDASASEYELQKEGVPRAIGVILSVALRMFV